MRASSAESRITLEVDGEGRILTSSPRALDGFGRRAADTTGKFASDLFVGDDVLSVRALLHRAARDEEIEPVYLRVRGADDGEIISSVSARGERDRVTVRIRPCDKSEMRNFRAAVEARVRHDPLTGLPNRQLLLERIERALVDGPCALVLVDLDGLRALVAALGTTSGDRILVEVADRLSAAKGPAGIVGLSGGQFALLVPSGDSAHLDALVARIQSAIGLPIFAGGEPVALSACLGLATGAGPAGGETLFAEAHTALSHAKSLGAARAATFDPALRRHAVRQVELQSELSRAVSDDELRLDFQPIVELGAAVIVGYEALVRWQHPHRGLLAPADFLGAAQRTGAGAAIDDWVLSEACRRAAAWSLDGNHTSVCVNVTPERFALGGFVDRVERALAATGLTPERLVIEITEWSILVDVAAARDTLAALNRIGVRVALDDYGTGYSSLADIAALAVDEIKIDSSFVAGLGSDRARTAIVHAIVGLGRALDITVVAEGVETEAQADDLRSLGCEFGQGFHFGRPAAQPALTSRTS